jgi:hypothetical protein
VTSVAASATVPTAFPFASTAARRFEFDSTFERGDCHQQVPCILAMKTRLAG